MESSIRVTSITLKFLKGWEDRPRGRYLHLLSWIYKLFIGTYARVAVPFVFSWHSRQVRLNYDLETFWRFFRRCNFFGS